MSRAFVKENDSPEALPDTPVSEHPNYVTPRGLEGLRARLDNALRHRAALAAEPESVEKQSSLAPLDRDIRWLQARVSGAIEVNPAEQPRDHVAFGATVTVRDDEGERRYRIVGEDEADAEQGSVSYLSPLAHALLGARVGDEVLWKRPAGDRHIEIVAVNYE
ncbi:transcription elongation GreA/GreB family factor [Luteibacter rhizovicinus]|uniref:Transcription elongation GreA/GreB family factor n=1 Tax=Luteibacter rhizovicinus TaxID=242606 RepID=A0A4R3YRT6_9GAMM|nr:GreA/GreB family elongation factor [Luteibacter rhizovicinus]TCV93974.1 transcription elongation GreA/GreB family factor [Luteibacter rhizovicinus]